MSNIQDFYNINHFPGDYDVNYCVSAAANGLNPYINFILDSIKKGDKVIDVGCGTGYITNTIATLKQNDITGLDFSNAINIAKEKSLLLNNNITWVKEDFFNYNNKYCPRDSKDQERFFKRKVKMKKDTQRKDIKFKKL